MKTEMNRFEKVAKAITERHGVHVEWAPANREYVVETVPCGSARKAEKYASECARRANHGEILPSGAAMNAIR